MKENVLDVLMYLFETYVDTDTPAASGEGELRDELTRAGFHDAEIDHALTWLDGLAVNEDLLAPNTQTSAGLRVFTDAEIARIDVSGRGYLLYLEQIGILQPDQRELVVDRLLALDAPEIDLEQIKWVVMMVLFSQPGQEQAFSRMEDLVFEEYEGNIH
ncbi:MAG: DUF494 domain-containing protein [Pseudomonadota bacterium]